MKHIGLFLITLLILNLSALAAPVTLLCKNIQTHPLDTPDVSFNTMRRLNVTYTKVLVSTPTGTASIYAPTSVSLTKKFFGINFAAGANGQFLNPGQCGLAAGVITGIDTNTASVNPVIVFNGLNQYSMDMTVVNKKAANNPIPVLPTCASGIHRIVAQQFDANSYSVSSLADITCVP